MTTTPEAATKPTVETASETPHRSSYITPEMIEKNPVLAAAGMFADDPVFDELILEIRKERERERRRAQKEFPK